ncbi:hypothetical protein KAM469_37540 [Aeromonas caviae]|nr:hypothetical protein KAM468_36470 [Aeromonas caviae]GKR29295.1 hypothetical protein KAM469_37540 [Aeromonas caviae]GKR33620.1 hypothetical protein KAM470_36930 [Aeromonas caviae]GKR57256.1 hypothetical protein KAM476_21210 [Aeromonas caviae]GKR63036.1 hypothetical protein KAM477_36580 [Aeromonas caviae]
MNRPNPIKCRNISRTGTPAPRECCKHLLWNLNKHIQYIWNLELKIHLQREIKEFEWQDSR